MTTDDELNWMPNDMRQSASLTGPTLGSPLHRPVGAYPTGRDPKDTQQDAINTLNELLESCRDGEFGFRECAAHTTALDIKSILNQLASQCRFAATELQALIVEMGGEPDEGGTASEALHRGWVAVKGTLSGYSDFDMLDECERAEDVALAKYRDVAKMSLPDRAKTLVAQHLQGVQHNHDQVKSLRNALKSHS